MEGPPVPVTRRAFIGGMGALLASAGCRVAPTPGPAPTRTTVGGRPGRLRADPFTLGVASGDPRHDRVVIWTRLAPSGAIGSRPVPVEWEVASDERFARVVARGEAVAVAADAHSVHVDVAGLEPGRWYHYRFRAGGHLSPAGRTGTMPAPGGRAPHLRVAFASCQAFTDGYYAAHRHLAADDPDLVLWLGDYIYEGGPGGPGAVRRHDGPEATTLTAYRSRYALYRSDPDLQAAHAAAPWAVTWDDHEVDNNYAGDRAEDGTPPPEFRRRRAAAYRAWWEHQPVRLPPPSDADYRIHRSLDAGRLLRVAILDGRQYRTDQPCGRPFDLGPTCPAVEDPAATMLGAEQEAWLDRVLSGSPATWNLLANQTVLTPTPIPLGAALFANLDQWDGYPAARRRLLATLARTRNPVVVTGDIHASMVSDVRADPVEPGSRIVATEFTGTSVSSEFPTGLAGLFEAAAAANPNVRYANARRRGYVRLDITPREVRADYRLLADARDPRSPVTTAASFVVAAGRPGAEPA
jgi:alkaline phosphatase D